MIIVVVIMIRLAVVMINNKSYLFRSFFSRYNTNYKYVFLFPFIVSYFKKDLPDEITEIANWNFNMFILTLIALFCFINVIGYFLSIYLINIYDIKNKYPKFNKIIKYYENYNLLFIILESLICLSVLIFKLIIHLSLAGLAVF